MAIFFGTARNQFPDFFSGSNTPADQLFDVAQDTLGKALSIAGARIFNGSFVEDGVHSVNGSAFIGSRFSDLVTPSRRQFLTQAPQATVFIKKRMFSTLRQNYDIRFMDPDERLLIRTIKNLFRRKCEEIAFYENLVNIKKIVSDPSFLTVDGLVSDLAQILGVTAGTGALLGGVFDALVSSLATTFPWFGDLQRMQKTNERAKQNRYTTWVVDPDQPDFSGTGPGVGVIELTMATNINTTVSLKPGGGSCSIALEDPYQLTLITEADVDFALRQARAEETGMAGFLDVTAQNNLRNASDLDQDLNTRLRGRRAFSVNFEFPLGPNAGPIGNIIETGQLFDANSDLASFGFDIFEQATILQIFALLESYKTLQDRTSGMLLQSTARANQIRSKLRAEFVGHHIFQQMDAVHIFMNGFTRNETPIYANRSDLLLGELAEAIVSPEEQQGRISDEALDQERQVLAPSLPLFLYRLLRNPTEWRATGPQVFSGLVKTVNSSYENGLFRLNVTAADNTEFLQLSELNTQPSLEQPEGALMDPLTPFDLVLDETSGIVIDKKLSQINQDRLKFLKFDNGAPVGSEGDLINDTSQTGTIVTYQHVPGIVYKWKSGIVSQTLNVGIAKPLARAGITHTLDDLGDDFGINLFQDAFSNLDAADILSIVITGQPYNYNTFIRNALDAGNFTVDNDTNSKAYFNFLFDYLDRQQSIWGGFVPAKESAIDPEKSADLFKRQRDLTRTVTKIADFRRELANKQDMLRKMVLGGTPGVALNDRIAELTEAIERQLTQLNSSDLFTALSPFKFYGNAVQVQLGQDEIRDLGNRLKYIVKKKPEEVRFNQDKNHFIVSDKYDTDLDIQAFVLKLKGGSPELFKSEWRRPIDICEATAKMLDFEFFADSQGNIRFRPPEYNKTPLSLLLQMVQLGRRDGISLAPPFLLQLVSSRIELVKQKLLTLELEILEKGILLGIEQPQIQSQFGISLALENISTNEFRFRLNEELIIQEGNRSSAFNEDKQQQIVFKQSSSVFEVSGLPPNLLDVSASKIIDIRNQLGELRGSTTDRLIKDTDTITKITGELRKFESANVGAFTARLGVSNTIAQLISQRQSLIPMFFKLATEASQLNSADEGLNLNSWNIIPEALGSFLDGAQLEKPILPRVLEDLIENDLANFDGFNSGRRFIINDSVVLSMDFSIRTPEFTRCDVVGSQNLVDFNGVLPVGEGSGLFWAGATDFDLWRQYGYRGKRSDNKQFLQDPETQCAPYAVFQLIRQRRYIHAGSVTVVGNEHYQVGDVVYVNSRQLMYYVEEVQHSLNISRGTFTTRLTLTYGHPLGEYIPTPLDLIGKTLLAGSKRPFSGIKTVRTLVPDGTLVTLETLVLPSDISPASQTDFERMNANRIQNAIQRAATRLASNDNFSIEIRSYFSSQSIPLQADFSGSFISSANANVAAAALGAQTAGFYANVAKTLLVRGATPKADLSPDGQSLSAGNITAGLGISTSFLTDDKITIPMPVDIAKPLKLEDLRLRRMPSEQAWANALDQVHGGAGGLPTNSIDIVLLIDKSVLPNAGNLQQIQDAQKAAASAAGEAAAPVAAGVNDFNEQTLTLTNIGSEAFG